MDFTKVLFAFPQSPIEITRDNWIVGSSLEEPTNTFYELHYCTSERYKQGYLIDDVWSEHKDCSYKHKVDVYIISANSSSIKDFYLNNTHTYFLHCKDVKKTFISLDDCPFAIKEYINEKNFVSIYKDYKSEPAISIITTVFNNAELLEQTIQSVVNQKSCNFEYIVKDANSKDNFKEVIERYADCCITVISERDQGIYDGMHQGFLAANGDYLQILNSDDLFYDSNVVDRYVNEITSTHADGYCSDILIRFPDGKSMLRKANLSKLKYRACVNHTSLAIKKDKYFALGGFDMSLRIAADYDLTIKLVKNGCNIQRLDMVCVNFRAEGASNSGYSWKMLKENLICRFRVSPFNVQGYLFALAQCVKVNISRYINRHITKNNN